MKYYDENLKLLEKERPNLFNAYMDFTQKNDKEYCNPCGEIECHKAKDGTEIFTIDSEKQKIRLNSAYFPYYEAERWAEKFNCNNIKVNAVLFGMGNGIFARVLLKRLKSDAKLYLYEPNIRIFSMALQYADISDLILDNRVYFFVEDINGNEFHDLLSKHTHWTNLATQICGYHTGYDRLFPEAYRNFLTIVEKADRLAVINKDTQIFFADNMVNNMLSNMKYIKDGRVITDYQGFLPDDVPAIIVAAGPSLDKNIDKLKKAKGKAFLIAVDTALRHLIRHGIMPDAMVTLDPNKPFDYMNDPVIKNIPLFCILESNRQILEFHEGTKIWFQGGSFLEKLFKNHGKKFLPYNPGGSVATAAFSICVALKMKRIVFVGQDLAYQGDITHAGGEKSHILNENYGIKLVDGIDGKNVKSRYDWIIYRDWFEDSIQSVKNDIHVIDATEGGALIHGTEVMTLDDVIKQYCTHKIDINQIINKMPPAFNAAEYDKVKEEIKGYLLDLSMMKTEADEAVKNCTRALEIIQNNVQDLEIDKYRQNILRTTKKMAEYEVYDFIDIYMSQNIDQYLSKVFVISDDKKQDEIDMFENAKMIFINVADSVQVLKPRFEAMILEL